MNNFRTWLSEYEDGYTNRLKEENKITMSEETEILGLNNEDVKEYIELLGKVTREFMEKKRNPNFDWSKSRKWWEGQQKQKDWEIIERVPKTLNANALLIGGDDAYEIKKVKRLSDNKVFSVGDIYEGYGSLLSIVPDKDYEILFWFSDGPHIAKIIAKSLKKVKQPLFKTEDGKDIFEGDLVWVVNQNFQVFQWHDFNLGELPSVVKVFSTEKAAKEYIEWNKPILSMAAVMSITELAGFPSALIPYSGVYRFHQYKLKQLVEQKLNEL